MIAGEPSPPLAEPRTSSGLVPVEDRPETRVLVVDDDEGVRAVVHRGLTREGCDVVEADDGASALAAAANDRFDVVVLDLHLPDTSGLDVLEQLRRHDPTVHVIILTGAGRERDRVLGLVSGADDYLVKPFSVRELAARVLSAQRRRALLEPPPVVEAGPVRIDVSAREVRIRDVPVALTRREFDLLAHLVSHPGRTFSREELLAKVWGSSAEWQTPATVTEHVRRLRLKVEDDLDDSSRIVTVRGVGYRFEVDAEPVEPEPHASWTLHESVDASVILRGTTVVQATPAALALIGADGLDAVLGRDVLSFVAPGSRAAALKRLEAVADGRSPRPEAVVVRRLDGGERTFELHSMPVQWAGERASQLTMWDVTDDPHRVEQLASGTAAVAVDPVDPVDEADAHRLAVDRALAAGEFVVYYQPVLDLCSGRWTGAEALLRWNHPERGLLTPADFIGPAERSGAIRALGAFVIDEACRQWARWRDAGHDLCVNVNVSGPELSDEQLPHRLAQAVESCGMPPDRLCLEVTETSLVTDFDAASAALRRACDLGARVSIDDFGTGWASLTYLRQLPVHALKIDASFVHGICTSPTDAGIVTSVLHLAGELGLTAVAEGIETPGQRDALLERGCRMGQGYLLGPPVPPDALRPLT